MRRLSIVLILSVVPAMAADMYTFTVPAAVNVSGPPGTPIVSGWGYSIHNESASNWLVTTDLTAGAFLHATPDLLFDFPDLAPGTTVNVPFNPVDPATGLYQIVWDSDAPANYVNAGTFDLSAQWWSGDPTHGGTLIGNAPASTQAYSASPTVATPEPAALNVAGLLLLAIAFRGRSTWRKSASS